MREPSALNVLPEATFAGVLDRAQRLLYTFVCGLIADNEQARDLVQDDFCDAWRAAQRLRPPFTDVGTEEDMRRWLFHAAYCRAVSLLRRRRLLRWISLERSLESGTETEIEHPEAPSAFEDQVAEGVVLRAALARLSPEDAACVLLGIVLGFTTAEIAPDRRHRAGGG
jgi:RNA polymerase sigma factor (sigma-70 family)